MAPKIQGLMREGRRARDKWENGGDFRRWEEEVCCRVCVCVFGEQNKIKDEDEECVVVR
jgi:hypothetical protein